MKNIQDIFIYAIYVIEILLAVILTGHPFTDLYYPQLTIVYFLLSTSIVFINHRKVINRQVLKFVITLILLIVVSACINLDNDLGHYLGVILTLISTMFCISSIKRDDAVKVYLGIIFIIGVVSSLFTLYLNVINIGMPSKWIDINGWTTFHYIYNIWGRWNPWISYVRNAGFFREPGVMGMHMCMAGIILMEKVGDGYSFDKKEIVMFIVFVLNGLLTLSTVGVCCTFLLILLYFVKRRAIKVKYIIAIIAVIVLAIIIANNFSTVLFSKFRVDSIYNISLQDRIQGFYSSVNVAMNNPLFGMGYSYYHRNASSVVTVYFTELWGKYGIFFPLIVTYAVIKFIVGEAKHNEERLIIGIIVFSFLLSQGFSVSPMILIWEMYALIKNNGIER